MGKGRKCLCRAQGHAAEGSSRELQGAHMAGVSCKRVGEEARDASVGRTQKPGTLAPWDEKSLGSFKLGKGTV